jgi:mannose-6-phosphate isomerase-like protein (cupin superfamily)
VDARRLVGDERIVGLSATTPDDFRGDPDYFGVGAVYGGTPTKPESQAGGLELVRAARDTLRVPWFAIGGVERQNVVELAAAGAAGVAVVRAIRDDADPEGAARSLRAALPPTSAVVASGDKAFACRRSIASEWSLVRRNRSAPHTHGAHTDVFYVLSGEIEMRLGDETVRLPADRGPRRRSCTLPYPERRRPYFNPYAPGGWASGPCLSRPTTTRSATTEPQPRARHRQRPR